MSGAFRTADATCPAHGAEVVVPSDVTLIPTTRGLYIGVTGNLQVEMADGQIVIFTALPVGFAPIQVVRVYSTNTTATTMLALY